LREVSSHTEQPFQDLPQDLIIALIGCGQETFQRDGNLVHSVGRTRSVDTVHRGREPHRWRHDREHVRIVEHDRRDAANVVQGRGREQVERFASDNQAGIDLAAFQNSLDRELTRVVPRVSPRQVHAERIPGLPAQHAVGSRDVAV